MNVSKILFLQDSFRIIVPEPAPKFVNRLGAAIHSRKLVRVIPPDGYEGSVSDGGFTINRIGTGKGDTKPAVAVQGTFRPENDQTDVDVRLQHGWHMMAFSWMLLFIAVNSGLMKITGAMDKEPALRGPMGWLATALLIAMAVFFHWGLYRDIRRVSAEVRSLVEAS